MVTPTQPTIDRQARQVNIAYDRIAWQPDVTPDEVRDELYELATVHWYRDEDVNPVARRLLADDHPVWPRLEIVLQWACNGDVFAVNTDEGCRVYEIDAITHWDFAAGCLGLPQGQKALEAVAWQMRGN